MKHIHFMSMLVVFFVVSSATAQAKEIVGITEDTFQQLQTSHCSYEQPAGMVSTKRGGYCDPLIAQLEDAIVMRVEAHGEQYWINTGDGLPVVNRYLPNGMYTTGKKLYWVQGGFVQQLKKGRAFSTILRSSQWQDSVTTPISNADFDRMMRSCEYYGVDNPTTNPQYQACVLEYNQGQITHTQLQRSIVMKVQDAGMLYYIPAGGDSNPVSINKRVLVNGQRMSLYTYLKSQAIYTQQSIIDEMPKL